MSHHDRCKQVLESLGYTQMRIDIGARRGEFGGLYVNLYQNIGVSLFGCTFNLFKLDRPSIFLAEKEDQCVLIESYIKQFESNF